MVLNSVQVLVVVKLLGVQAAGAVEALVVHVEVEAA